MIRRFQTGQVSENLLGFVNGRLANEVVADGQGYSFRAAGHVQLAEDVADVGFDGRRADAQFLGDFGVIQPFNHQGQYSPLTLRQVVAGRWRLGGGVD